MIDQQVPRPPKGLEKHGRRFWRLVCSGLELDPHEGELLEQACRILDRLAALDAHVREQACSPRTAESRHP